MLEAVEGGGLLPTEHSTESAVRKNTQKGKFALQYISWPEYY